MSGKNLMSMSITQDTWRLFVASVPAILRRVLPLMVVVSLLEMVSESLSGFLAVLAWCSSTLIHSWAKARVIVVLLQESGNGEPRLAIRPAAFVAFVFAEAYVLLATMLATFFLVIPGLLLYVSSLLVPVLVLRHALGPFEAIAGSVDRMRGAILSSVGAVVLLWVLLMAVSAGFGFLVQDRVPAPITQALSIILSLLFFVIDALGVVLYRRLCPVC